MNEVIKARPGQIRDRRKKYAPAPSNITSKHAVRVIKRAERSETITDKTAIQTQGQKAENRAFASEIANAARAIANRPGITKAMAVAALFAESM